MESLTFTATPHFNTSTAMNHPPHGASDPSYYLIGLSFVLLLAMTASAHFVCHDYRKFKALGPGGTPSTIQGYLRIKFLGLFAVTNPYMPPSIPPEIYLNRPAYLSKSELPQRRGARPIVDGIAPHRQLNQRPDPAVFAQLRDCILSMGETWPLKLRYGTSCLEKHGPGLFALQPVNRSRHCSGEVCHAHPSDGSIHLTLHPADAAVVILRGWGERHPLSSGGWLARFVPQGFALVYAPRTKEEVAITSKIIAAAVWWVGDVDVEGKFRVKDLEPLDDEAKEEAVKAWDEPACAMPALARKMAS